MVYDSPKAAHFDAVYGSGKLADHDPVGVQHRWAAAVRVSRDLGITDMLHLTKDDEAAIDVLLARMCEWSKIKVVRRQENWHED